MTRARPWLASGLAGDTLYSLAAIAIVGGSSAAYSLLVGRWLGAEALGLAGLGLGLGLGAAQVAASGIAPATTRFTAAAVAAGRPHEAAFVLRRGLLATTAVGALLALAARLSAPWWSVRIGLPPQLVTATVCLLVAQSAYFGLKASLYGLGQVRRYALLETIAGLAFAAALAVLLLRTTDWLLAPFLAANLAFAVLATPAVARAVRRLHPPAAHGPPGLTGYAAVATLGSSAALARLSLTPLVTGYYRPPAEVGLLQAALSFLLLVMFLPRALELALFPLLSAAHGRADAASLRRQAEAALAAAALVLGAVAGFVVLASQPLLAALYGPSFASAHAAVVWVAVSGWALGLAVPAVAALSGSGAVWVPNGAALLALAASALVWAWRVPLDGAAGAAIGLAAGSLVNAGVPLLAAHRLLGVRLRPTASVVCASCASLLVALGCRRWLAAPDLPLALGHVALLAWLQRARLRQLLRTTATPAA